MELGLGVHNVDYDVWWLVGVNTECGCHVASDWVLGDCLGDESRLVEQCSWTETVLEWW